MPMTSSSWVNCGPSCTPPPMHAASTVRPCDNTSRLAHCKARRIGSRSGRLARQMVPNLTCCVRAAMADSVTIASARGFDSRLSPTQIPSKYPDASAVSAALSRSSNVAQPKSIARVDRLRPNWARIGCGMGVSVAVQYYASHLMGLSPGMPLAHLHGERHLESPDAFHRLRNTGHHLCHGVFRDLEQQLIVDLQQHVARQVLSDNLVLQVHHSEFDQVSGRALERHIDGGTLGCLTDG